MRLKGKRLIVTGAANGIGRATAEKVAAEGAILAAFDADPRVEELKALEAAVWQMDVSQPDAVEKAVDEACCQMGGVDGLLHVAGIMRGQRVPLTELDDGDWQQVIAVNLTGSYLMAKHVARHMIPAGQGAIVFTASGAGVSGPSGSIAYGASKGGVHGLAMTVSDQLSQYGIRVHDVCPGSVDTPLIRRSIAEGARRDPARYESVVRSLVPPERIAEIFAFLVSDEASHMRGTVYTR